MTKETYLIILAREEETGSLENCCYHCDSIS